MGYKLVNAREIKRDYERWPEETTRNLTEALEAKELRPEHFSVRDLYEAFLGTEALHAISFRKSGGMNMRLLEAGDAVNTAAFSNITGQLIFSKIKEGYENPAFLWPSLCETVPTTFLDGELIPGIGPVGDKAETVGEANEFPEYGLTEVFLQTVRLQKRGFIIPVTREIVVADRTGMLLKVAGEGGKYLGINREKRVIDVAVGVVNNYKRNGVASNTYLTSGAYINTKTTNALADWTNVEAAELLFDAITDPDTGEPIVMPPNLTVLVPTALKYTAKRVFGAGDVERVDNQASATTYRTHAPNPLSNYPVLSSPYVKARTSSASTWFIGDFKKAFAYMEAWSIETLQAASNSEAEFTRDIVSRFKCSEMGNAQVLEPRVVCKNTA